MAEDRRNIPVGGQSKIGAEESIADVTSDLSNPLVDGYECPPLKVNCTTNRLNMH